jgi:tetratricopeptide (TPR) repeat protein
MLWVNTKKTVMFAVLAAAIVGAAPLFGQTGGLAGDATDEKGNPMAGCMILIERQEIKGNYKVKTDKKGHYVYVGLPIGNYKVTLTDPSGREVFHYGGVHIGLGDPTEQNFNMAKERAEQAKQIESNPELKKKAEEQKAQTEEAKQVAGLKSFYDQGQALYNDKKYAEAADMFEKAVPLAKDKNLAVIYAHLGDAYEKGHQFDKAVDAYQKAIAQSPSDAETHNSLGSTYAQMNKIPEAQAEFQKSAELNPGGASKAYFNLGAVFYNTGKMDEAAAAFKKSADLDPTFADAYALEGRALMGKLTMGPDGKSVIAPPGTVEALQTYLKLAPTGQYAAEVQGDLQVIQGTIQTEYKVEKKKKK